MTFSIIARCSVLCIDIIVIDSRPTYASLLLKVIAIAKLIQV